MPDESSDASNFSDQLQRPIRNRPAAFGIGKFGISIFSQRDATRYAWSRTKAVVTAFLLGLLLYKLAAADTFTTNLNLRKPSVDVEDSDTPWGEKINTNSDTLDAAILDKRVGGTIIGNLTVTGSLTAASSVSISSSVSVSTLTVGVAPSVSTFNYQGALAMASGASLTMAGSGGFITNSSSINASAFFGNGAGITSISSSAMDSSSVTLQGNSFNAANKLIQADGSGFIPNANLDPSSVTKLGPSIDASELPADGYAGTYVNVTGDNMTGQLTTSSTITVQGNAFSIGGSTLSVSAGTTTINRLQLSNPLAVVYGGTGANLAATGGSGQYVKQAGAGAAFTVGVIASGDLPSDGYASTYVNAAGDAMTGQLTLSGSTLTVTGNAFSVGTSTFVVSGGRVGIGTTNPGAPFSVTASVAEALHVSALGLVRAGGGYNKATILASTPDEAAAFVTCLNCSVDTVCFSTGTSAGQWSSGSDRTAACN